jgi:hypothetical protein
VIWLRANTDGAFVNSVTNQWFFLVEKGPAADATDAPQP